MSISEGGNLTLLRFLRIWLGGLFVDESSCDIRLETVEYWYIRIEFYQSLLWLLVVAGPDGR